MTNTNISIATIITCHNRKEKTLTCLTDLMNQDVISGIDLNVYLVDDGSTDGTGDAVKQNFPHVNILQGDGTLYWNGGMRFAFSEAMKNDKWSPVYGPNETWFTYSYATAIQEQRTLPPEPRLPLPNR